MNNPTARARMGDFGIRTPAEFDALNGATRLTGAYFHGMAPDFDFYYILRIGDVDGPMIGGVSIAQRAASVPQRFGGAFWKLTWAKATQPRAQGNSSSLATPTPTRPTPTPVGVHVTKHRNAL
jgi:hypothetical protein